MQGQWGKLVGYFVATLIVTSLITFALPLIGGGEGWLPDLLSHEGDAIDKLFWGLMIMSVIIFAMVAAFVIYAMVHFRAAPGDMSDGAHIHGSARLEIVWIVIPTIIVAVIAVFSYIVLEDNEIGLYDKAKANDKGAATLLVDVHAFSFGWGFRYSTPTGSRLTPTKDSSSQLVLPVDEVVKFDVLSCSGRERLGRIQEETFRQLKFAESNEDHAPAEGEEHEEGESKDRFTRLQPGICEREWDLTTPEAQTEMEKSSTLLYKALKDQAAGEKLSPGQQKLVDDQPTFRGDQQYVDVNHAFWVPEARLKIDAVAGLRTYVQWRATSLTRPSDNYQVVCAELCGTGHNAMRTDMCVIEKSAFDWWTKLELADRVDATCDNLRVFNCFKDVDDYDALLKNVIALTKEDPELGCREAQEALA